MDRINQNGTIDSMIEMIAERNIGAIAFLQNILANPSKFSPPLPYTVILNLDEWQIYGKDIYNLGEYVCKQDLQVLDEIRMNYTFGYISAHDIREQVTTCRPFNKLYTKEEIVADQGKGNLPPLKENTISNKTAISHDIELEHD